MFIWEGKSLGDLYTKMRSEMPTDQPGSLPAQSYADILAFILMSNEFPAGEHEVAANGSGLDDILIAPQ